MFPPPIPHRRPKLGASALLLPGGPPPTALMVPRGFELGASGAIVLARGVTAGLALRND